MRTKTINSGGERYEIEFTDKRVTGFGGLSLMFRFLDTSGALEMLRRVLPDGRRSPNQIQVTDYVRSLFCMVLIGCSRFSHSERLKLDGAVAEVAEIKRVPTGMSLTRYFGKFLQSHVQDLKESIGKFIRAALPVEAAGHTIDLDSTIFGRYGRQEGATKGYNPKRRGGLLHLPLLAFSAEAKMIVHSSLRAGNASPLRGVIEFFDELLARMGDHKIRVVRADTGFFSNEFLLHLESKSIPYVIAVKLSQPIKRMVRRVSNAAWQQIGDDPDLHIAEVIYDPVTWIKPRRLIIVREKRTSKTRRSDMMFDIDDFSYRVMVTTLTSAPVEVWRDYNNRGDCENRIKELKNEFNADGFALHSFSGTDAVFELVCFLFNLMAWFKLRITENTSPMLPKVRTQLFVVGVAFGRTARTKVLRVALKGGLRDRFRKLWERVCAFHDPTVTHLLQTIDLEAVVPSRQWSNQVNPLTLTFVQM